MKSVLIIGNDTRSFLTSIRSFGRQNFNVYTLNCNKEIILKSRYIFCNFNIIDFEIDKDAWCVEFHKILSDVHFDFVLPVDDPSILKLQYYEKRYKKIDALFLESYETLAITNDKEKSTELAEKLGVPVARHETISSIELVIDIVNKNRFPFVVKPHSSFSEECTAKKDTVLIIENEKEFWNEKARIESYLSKYGSIIIQEFFSGVGTGVELLAKNGNILVAFQHVRVHEPPKGGGSSLRKSVPVDERLLEDSAKIIKELSYTGVLMIEYKMNMKTGEYIFIEINARFWGSLPLAVECGVDFPYYLYQMLKGDVIEFDQNYKTHFYQQNFETDLGWKKIMLSQHRYSLLIRETIIQCIRILFRKEGIDEYAYDDKKVFLELLRVYYKRFIRHLLYKKYNMNPKRLCVKPNNIVSVNDNVVFVCYGNICRSSFAKVYRSYICNNESNTDSGGYYRIPGRKMNSEIAQIAEELYGIRDDSFRSKIVDKSMLEKADYIFCFDINNYIYITLEYGQYKKKVFLLGAYDCSDESNVEIPDPYEMGLKEKQLIIERIAKIIDANLGTGN